LAFAVFCLSFLVAATSRALPLSEIKLPPGFEISLFAEGLESPRSLALSPQGTVFVGSRTSDKVYALVDRNGDGRADERYVIGSKLQMPNGVAFHAGSLYVAELSRILRYDKIDEHLRAVPAPLVLAESFPAETHHGWRYLRIGPDKHIYLAIGAPCNVCRRQEEVFATILRLDLEGGGREIFAAGIRNSVGFDWHPDSRELWFTDNGRDWLGDDQPPDELNRAPVKGLHFGFPYCHGGSIADPEFGAQLACSASRPPVQKLGAHVAALGMRFYTGKMFPPAYQKQVFIAEHGSWNRSSPSGYRITLVRLQGDKAVGYEPLAIGWLAADGSVRGRPVDLLQLADGSLLVSDDAADCIYRISYR